MNNTQEPLFLDLRSTERNLGTKALSQLAIYGTRKEATEAARAIGWSGRDVTKAYGRFQVLWGLYDPIQGYLTQRGYATLRARRQGAAAPAVDCAKCRAKAAWIVKPTCGPSFPACAACADRCREMGMCAFYFAGAEYEALPMTE